MAKFETGFFTSDHSNIKILDKEVHVVSDIANGAFSKAGIASDTAKTALNRAQTAKDTAQAATETAQAAKDTAQAASNTAQTAKDTAQAATETAQTVSDKVDAFGIRLDALEAAQGASDGAGVVGDAAALVGDGAGVAGDAAGVVGDAAALVGDVTGTIGDSDRIMLGCTIAAAVAVTVMVGFVVFCFYQGIKHGKEEERNSSPADQGVQKKNQELKEPFESDFPSSDIHISSTMEHTLHQPQQMLISA